jgi:hypothetical protein
LGQKRCFGGAPITSGLPRQADLFGVRQHVSKVPILLKKSFSADERKFSGPLMRSARGDVRDHIVLPKTTTDLRIGPSGHCSGRVAETSALARFSETFDFRLLQHYLPTADILDAVVCRQATAELPR